MKSLVSGLFMVFACVSLAYGAPVIPKLRISLENTQTHVHTRAVTRFAQALSQRLEGRLQVLVFPNASLFRDRDIIQALAHDKLEMAVPGTWHITRFEPSAGIFLLPVFYGRPARANYQVLDSDIGREINQRIETSLGLKVVGRWLDLGHAHIFGVTREIRTHEDLKGIRIRVAGGLANKLRVEALGARPSIIAWPDLPEHMMQKKVDAVLTSYETVRSAALWKKGINSGFEDMEYFPQYVPLIRNAFWRRLSPDIQAIILETWEDQVDQARQMASQAQDDAKKALMDHGVHIIVPEAAQLAATRAGLMRHQDEFARETGIDPHLVRQVNHILRD